MSGEKITYSDGHKGQEEAKNGSLVCAGKEKDLRKQHFGLRFGVHFKSNGSTAYR